MPIVGITRAWMALLLLAITGCGGGSPASSPVVQAPVNLSYARPMVAYTKGIAIPAETPQVAGGLVETFSVSPALPDGLSLNVANGVISGTPAAVSPMTNYQVTASNRGGSSKTAISIQVDPPQSLSPDDPRIGQSDFYRIGIKDGTTLRLARPILDLSGFEACNPGARLARFRTNSRSVTMKLAYTGLVIREDACNTRCWVLVNGAPFLSVKKPDDDRSYQLTNLTVSFSTGEPRDIELIAAYGTSVDFLGVDLEATATITALNPRPSTKLVCMGDSITQGFWASDVVETWPFLLAVDRGYEIVNVGYGGRRCTPSDAAVATAVAPSVATYLIGYNDFSAQVPLAAFKANYIAFVQRFRAGAPFAKLYCITPLWSINTKPLTLEMYRQQIRDALTELGDSLNVLVEGTSLTSGPSSFNADGVHPNNQGNREMAAALGSITTTR